MAQIRFGVSGFNLRAEPRQLVKAINSALRRALKGLRQDIKAKVRERYTISSGTITKTLKVKVGNLSGEIASSGRANPLEKFKIQPSRRLKKPPASGIMAQNVRGQGGYIRRAFLQKSGGVYERVGKERYPLRRIKGPSAPGMLSSVPVNSFIIKKLAERLDKNLNHELQAVELFK